MKPASAARGTSRRSKAAGLFCSDLDGTLVGNPEACARFTLAWQQLSANKRPLLCYATGRLVDDVLRLLEEEGLFLPDYIIGGVGTQLYDVKKGQMVSEFHDRFEDGWDPELIQKIVTAQAGILPQPPVFTHLYKSSWFWPGATRLQLEELSGHLAAAGLKTTLVFSSQRDLDVLPGAADKGRALSWLCERLNLQQKDVVVAGDTGNDASMFLVPDVKGIVVENALPELLEALVGLQQIYRAAQPLADGVIEGLQHYQVLPESFNKPSISVGSNDLAHPLRPLIADEAFVSLTEADRRLIATGYDKAIEALRRNITPLGFSACSIEDNPASGTDVNYHSIWARDGAITLLDSLQLNDPDIRRAQEATLITLLDQIRPNGQPPANVRIADGIADYSGVGGICAIDSGLWLVIALYRWVQMSGDLALARRYEGRLRRLLRWLEAQDANGDGLLEVPEAGDWTDLFGRSYHVLYDEVLWFRAVEAAAGLAELLGHSKQAAERYHQAQHIRSRILHVFWPTTEVQEQRSINSFADQQFSIGDTRYLLAEITPFRFSWRCDVLGNIMASLASILDVNRSRMAFSFMWGVGVNDPHPVANLYPPVHGGDDEWRSYYAVNLLNLPGHYHNGGIWPFIGGMWVRFIHRLGLRDVACRELVKLAQLNRLGQKFEWEFTEWAHSRTGRPMGKAFQARSAASYIRACNRLQLAGEDSPADNA